MLDLFKEYRAHISKYISDYLQAQHQTLTSLNRWGDDSPVRISPFVNSGKLIRGGLSILAARMFGRELEDCLPLGAAMEFFQSAFLIHDDIMDMDEYRRGEKSLYFQYQEYARDQAIVQNLRAGQSLGICLGDVAFFWAYDLLNHLECRDDTRQRIISTASSEYVKVGLAQMEDVYFGFYPGEVSEQEILNVFRYKTARYTFSLPFMLGAIFAGAPRDQIDTLSVLGEKMGIIFQIKDDELGLFGQAEQLGKPIGSDISEGKKTLFRLYLMEASNETERNKLKMIFGNESLQPEDIHYVQEQIREKGVDKKISLILDELAAQSKSELAKLDISPEYKQVFEELMEYSLKRKY